MIENLYSNPYLFVLAFSMIIVMLFAIRYYLRNAKSTPEILIGNGQTLGKRKEQEDCFSTVMNENGVLAVLADGMGGFTNGRVASSLAVNTFVQEFSKSKNIEPIDKFFKDTSRLSNAYIVERAKGEKVGTTLVAVIISDSYLYWSSIGDSAIALFRNGEFINLNKKHIFQNVLEEQYLSGKITKEELLSNSKKNRLTNYMGHRGFRNIEICDRSIKIVKGDKIILCSDGVYNSVTELEMENVLSKRLNPFKAAEEIIEIIESKKRPNQDNATIVILEKND